MDKLPSTTITLDQPLTPLPRKESIKLAHIMNGLQFHRDSGKWEFSDETADRAPDEGERQWLASRRAHLIFKLTPAGEDRARTELISLIALMKNRNTDGNANGIAALYVKELAGLPWYGLEQACIAFKRNEVGDGWLPTPGELRQEAGQRAQWAHEEVGTIQTILNAYVPERESLETRQAAIARYRKIIRPLMKEADWPTGQKKSPKNMEPKPLPEPGSVVLPQMSGTLQALWDRKAAERGLSEE